MMTLHPDVEKHVKEWPAEFLLSGQGKKKFRVNRDASYDDQIVLEILVDCGWIEFIREHWCKIDRQMIREAIGRAPVKVKKVGVAVEVLSEVKIFRLVTADAKHLLDCILDQKPPSTDAVRKVVEWIAGRKVWSLKMVP